MARPRKSNRSRSSRNLQQRACRCVERFHRLNVERISELRRLCEKNGVEFRV